MRVPNIPNSTIKLMLFPFSLEGAARIWLEKEPPRSILTWDDLVSKFINQFFPPWKTTNLQNEITRFQQRFDESFSEAWDRFNDLLRACPHHGFSELHQLDTFYNALNVNDQDSLNSAAGGNFLDKMPSDCLKIIENKSKVRQSRAKAVVAKVNSNPSTPAISSDVAKLKDMVRALLLDKKNQSSAQATSSTPASIKAVESNCVTCGGTHSYQNCSATSMNIYQDNINESSSKLSSDQTSNLTSSTNPSPKGRIRRSSKQKQRFDESFFEAWDHFNDLLRACPHHGFFELHQLDTFYNALNINDQDSLNSAAGGNFLDKMPADCLKIIESKSKVRQTRAKAVVAKVNSNSSTLAVSSDVNQPLAYQALAYQAPVSQTQSVSQNDFERYIKANDAVLRNIQSQGQSTQNQCQRSGTLPGNTVTNPKEDLKGITTRSDVAYQGPTIPTPSKVAKQGTEVTKDQVQTPNPQSTAHVQPTVTQSESKTLVFEPVVAPVSAPMPNLKPSIPYPSRRDNERRRDQANEQIEKFYEIFKEMSFEISFTNALMLMPKFASTLKALIRNKKKLSEMARTPINEHCLAVILNKLPKKLGDPGKIFIPSLADLGTSINLMPLSVWKGLSLPELTPTCMTLELADRTESKPVGIAKDVKVKVGVFHFPADFVVVDFKPDPQVPLILGRCFLKTSRALIDVHKGKLTLRIKHEAITYNLDQTSRYSANYDQMTANKIDVIDEACEEYSQEVLSFSDVTASGGPIPSDDPIVSTTSPKLTSFRDSDFLLFEEADAFLGLEDDSNSSELDPSYYDLENDILLLEAILNSDPSPPLLNHEQSVPSFKEELKACEAKTIKSSIDEPPEVELKDLPPYLEYAFLEGDNKFPVIIAKELRDEKKSTLIKVLRSPQASHRLETI
nr:reverse transcriptase domain-containing protein [Tanacetum cinerariifolium]